MKLSDIINKDRIIIELKSNTKEDVINELIDKIKSTSQVLNFEKLKNAIFEREEVLSTGIGNGIAIPHCRTNSVEGIIAAFGRASNPVEFDSLDNKPVNILFLFASNENLNSEHLKLLNQLGKIAHNKDLLNKLLTAKNVDEIYSALSESNGSELVYSNNT